jgi:two-component system response regulator HydG
LLGIAGNAVRERLVWPRARRLHRRDDRTIGLVEAASGGTLFDELGDIPFSIQVKLLRLLETDTYRRVGSPELRKTEFRVVSATHRPLAEMVGEGLFRQDCSTG